MDKGCNNKWHQANRDIERLRTTIKWLYDTTDKIQAINSAKSTSKNDHRLYSKMFPKCVSMYTFPSSKCNRKYPKLHIGILLLHTNYLHKCVKTEIDHNKQKQNLAYYTHHLVSGAWFTCFKKALAKFENVLTFNMIWKPQIRGEIKHSGLKALECRTWFLQLLFSCNQKKKRKKNQRTAARWELSKKVVFTPGYKIKYLVREWPPNFQRLWNHPPVGVEQTHNSTEDIRYFTTTKSHTRCS